MKCPKTSANSRNDNPNTIWSVLARKLGREPTDKEAADEVKRILREVKERRDEADGKAI